MPGRRRQRLTPVAPDLPDRLAESPAEVDSGAAWSGLSAGAALAVPDVVHDVSLDECRLLDVDLTGRTLTGLTCRDVVFTGCDLSGAVLDGAVLDRVGFVGCRLTGTVLSGAELTDVVVEGGVANLANFRLSRSSYLWIRDAPVRDADFYAARVRHGALLGCDLTGTDFDRADIDGLALHGSTLDGIRGADAFARAGVTVAPDQLVGLGVAMLTTMDIGIGDDPTPG